MSNFKNGKEKLNKKSIRCCGKKEETRNTWNLQHYPCVKTIYIVYIYAYVNAYMYIYIYFNYLWTGSGKKKSPKRKKKYFPYDYICVD